MSREQFDSRRDVWRDRGMRDGAADEPGARSRGRGGLGRLRFCGSARRGREEIAQYRDEAWGAQSPKIRPSSSQRQQGGPEKSKPAGFVADGQFQPKCLGSEFSRQIAVDFKSNANLHKRGSCPGHSHLPFLSEERQTYSGPFQVARSAGRDMRQLPCGRIDCGVPERVRPMCLSARLLIDKSALIAACSMRQAREATTSISRWPSGDLSMFARIFRASQGTRWKSYSYSASISNLRGAGCPAALSAAARCVPPRGVNSFVPAALFLGIGLFAPPSARAATWQS